jgi:hypothetical protein
MKSGFLSEYLGKYKETIFVQKNLKNDRLLQAVLYAR